jgi:hypothetical protein
LDLYDTAGFAGNPEFRFSTTIRSIREKQERLKIIKDLAATKPVFPAEFPAFFRQKFWRNLAGIPAEK